MGRRRRGYDADAFATVGSAAGAGPRLVVSQDRGGGGPSPRWKEARAEISAAKKYLAKKCWPSLAPAEVVTHADDGQGGDGYHRLARHLKFALAAAFAAPGTTRVIVLEEDLEVAPDFFDFFGAVAPVLDADPAVLAASAWNDNGQRGRVDPALDAAKIVRSDFFGGLGWMLTRRVWAELEPKWPAAYERPRGKLALASLSSAGVSCPGVALVCRRFQRREKVTTSVTRRLFRRRRPHGISTWHPAAGPRRRAVFPTPRTPVLAAGTGTTGSASPRSAASDIFCGPWSAAPSTSRAKAARPTGSTRRS